MPQPAFSALLFDFDGTLARLTLDFSRLRVSIAALAEAFLGQRPEPTAEPVLEWLDALALRVQAQDTDAGPAAGPAAALELHSRGRLVIQAAELDAARESDLFEFTRPMLGSLRKKGIKTGILTRNSTAAVKLVFPDISDCCDAFLPREEAPRVKPDPAHVLALLERLGVAPRRALMVGDHPMDIETARRAGTAAAAVASGNSTPGVLQAAMPDFLARDCAELMDQLRAESLLP